MSARRAVAVLPATELPTELRDELDAIEAQLGAITDTLDSVADDLVELLRRTSHRSPLPGRIPPLTPRERS